MLLPRVGEGAPEVEISGLAYDNRSVTPGTLFFCVPGFTRDGHDFALRDATRRQQRQREPEDQRQHHRDQRDLEVDREALEDEADVVARRHPLPVGRVEEVAHRRIVNRRSTRKSVTARAPSGCTSPFGWLPALNARKFSLPK